MTMYISICFEKLADIIISYNARKRDKSSTPATMHKSKVENKPKEKEISNKRPRNNINL